MEMSLHLWLEYLLRFAHLIAGIAWIGSSFYFIWLDSSFESPKVPRHNVEGELFMVHGGFYYQVEKRKIYPGELPEKLHWFKWEATLTWVTGFLLLIVLYYLKGASLLVSNEVRSMSQLHAVGMSLGLIVLSWLIYDFLWNDKFIRSKTLSGIISIPYFAGLIYLNTLLFSGRGAFIQTGAVFGSLMLLNVWIRILPGQSKMIRDAQAGKVPDYSMSLKSKTRSVHNTYFIFPALFIMLSNHYGTLYNHRLNALILILLSISGAMVRHAMVAKRTRERWILVPAVLGFIALIFITVAPPAPAQSVGFISDGQVHAVLQKRCVSCHSSHPTDDVFKVPPLGAVFETPAQVRMYADRIYQQVVVSKNMPLGNKTQMTDDERLLIYYWLKQ